jgi:hypothetical protein
MAPHHYFAGAIQPVTPFRIYDGFDQNSYLVTGSVGSGANNLSSGALRCQNGNKLLLCLAGMRAKDPQLINGGISGPYGSMSWNSYNNSHDSTTSGNNRSIEWWYSNTINDAYSGPVAVDVDSSGYAVISFCIEMALGSRYSSISPTMGFPSYNQNSYIDFGVSSWAPTAGSIITGMAAWAGSTFPDTGDFDGAVLINEQYNGSMHALVFWKIADGTSFNPYLSMPSSVDWITSLVSWVPS